MTFYSLIGLYARPTLFALRPAFPDVFISWIPDSKKQSSPATQQDYLRSWCYQHGIDSLFSFPPPRPGWRSEGCQGTCRNFLCRWSRGKPREFRKMYHHNHYISAISNWLFSIASLCDVGNSNVAKKSKAKPFGVEVANNSENSSGIEVSLMPDDSMS